MIKLFSLVKILLLTLILGGTSACTSLPKVEETAKRVESGNFPNHSAKAIISSLEQSVRGLNSFSSKTVVKIDSPQQKRTVTAQMQHRASDSLTAKISINLGIEVARSLATPDSFFVYDRIRKRLYKGENEIVLAQLSMSGNFEELFPNLTGLIVPDIGLDPKIEADSLNYTITRSDGKFEWKIDPGFWRVVVQSEYDSNSELVEKRSFSGYVDVDGVPIPRRIVLTRPMENTTVQFVHQSIVLNPATLNLEFEPGKVSQVIEL